MALGSGRAIVGREKVLTAIRIVVLSLPALRSRDIVLEAIVVQW